MGSAAALLVWAFVGWEAVTSLSGEYRDPARDIGRATGIVVIAVLYLGIAFATVVVLGDEPGRAPLSDLLVLGLGEWARPVVTVIALLLSLGAMNSYFAGGCESRRRAGEGRVVPGLAGPRFEHRRVPRRSLGLLYLCALTSPGVIVSATSPSMRR